MVSPAREYSLEQYLLERLKFSGMQKENLTDLANIIALEKQIPYYSVCGSGAGRAGASRVDRAVLDGHAAVEQADERVAGYAALGELAGDAAWVSEGGSV